MHHRSRPELSHPRFLNTAGVKELAEQFPGLSEPIIKARLRDRCECVPFKVRADLYLEPIHM